MINTLYVSGALISGIALWMGADYRAIGVSMALMGAFTFARFYLCP